MGDIVGEALGQYVVGFLVGVFVGLGVGLIVFATEGNVVGNLVGDVVVGRAEGSFVGRVEGADGLNDGRTVGRDGLIVERTEGLPEGALVLLNVGAFEGALVVTIVGGLVVANVGSEVGRKVLVGSLSIKLGTMLTTPKSAAIPATILIGPEPTRGSFSLAKYVCESIPRKVGTELMIDAATRLISVRQLLPFTNVAAPLASMKTSKENGPIVTSKTSPETYGEPNGRRIPFRYTNILLNVSAITFCSMISTPSAN